VAPVFGHAVSRAGATQVVHPVGTVPCAAQLITGVPFAAQVFTAVPFDAKTHTWRLCVNRFKDRQPKRPLDMKEGARATSGRARPAHSSIGDTKTPSATVPPTEPTQPSMHAFFCFSCAVSAPRGPQGTETKGIDPTPSSSPVSRTVQNRGQQQRRRSPPRVVAVVVTIRPSAAPRWLARADTVGGGCRHQRPPPPRRPTAAVAARTGLTRPPLAAHKRTAAPKAPSSPPAGWQVTCHHGTPFPLSNSGHRAATRRPRDRRHSCRWRRPPPPSPPWRSPLQDIDAITRRSLGQPATRPAKGPP